MMDTQDLLRDYPLVVQFPKLRGEYLMLNWWSNQEQNHVSLARTQEGIVRIYERLLDDESFYDAEPMNLYRINIVSPPMWLQIRGARRQMRIERQQFGHWIGDSLRELEPDIPSGYTKCQEYRPNERQGYSSRDDWEADRHWGCMNCYNGYKLSIPLSQLFLKKRNVWLKINGGTFKVYRPCEGPSLAPTADPLKPLYVVADRHGHHRDGTFLQEAGQPDDTGLYNDIKFFCHADLLPMIPELPAMMKARNDAWEKERDESRAADDAKNEEIYAQRRQEIRVLLEEIAKS